MRAERAGRPVGTPLNNGAAAASKGAVTRVLALSLLLAGALPAGRVSAQPAAQAPSDASTERLGLLRHADREALRPYLERGPVGLVEFTSESGLPGVIFATRVRAPARRVAELLADPTSYPRYMPALDSVSVQSREGGATAYSWTWRTAIFHLTGRSLLSTFEPGARRDRPFRIESRATHGDMGVGRFVFRVYPDGPRESLLVLSSRVDLRDANFITRQLNTGARSINRTINISLACVMVLGTKAEAERLAGVRPEALGDRPPLARPDVDIGALAVLLARGDLLFLHMSGTRLDQLAVVGRIGRDLARTREVMTDPREFGPALVPGSYARVTAERDRELDFEWGIDLPLVGSSGTMTLRDTGSVVEIDAIDGSLEGGRWRFDTEVYPWGEAVVLGWADFDPAKASWLIRLVVQEDEELGYGLASGSEIMVLRAIRSRAWRVHEQRAAAAASGG